jgi:hypothetical protein
MRMLALVAKKMLDDTRLGTWMGKDWRSSEAPPSFDKRNDFQTF